MKKRIFIVLGIIILAFLIIYGVIFYIDYRNVCNGKIPVFAKENSKETYQGLGYSINVKYYNYTDNIETMDMYAFGRHVAGIVICYDEPDNSEIDDSIITIENGNIKNENLLDSFIESANNKQNAELQIDVISNGNTETINLEYIVGDNYINYSENENSTINMTVPDKTWAWEDYGKYYGYYKLTQNGTEKIYDDYHHDIIRQTSENIVSVIFYSEFLDVIDIPVICEYNLDTSGYEKIYGELTYVQRKDTGINKIAEIGQYDNSDFGVYTYGGDVLITVDGDMVYSLENALNSNILTTQDLIDQAKLDEKYGICQIAYFNDGGSIEYLYNDYTILKYNTLDGNKDLFISMPQSLMPDLIINMINETNY